MPKQIIADASLCLKWFFQEENESSQALILFNDFIQRKVGIIVPTIWLYEMTNGIRSAVLRKRITKNVGANHFQDLLKVLPDFVDFNALIEKTYNISEDFNLSIYDSSYLSLAIAKKSLFLTGDDKLYKKVAGKIKFVKPLASYLKV